MPQLDFSTYASQIFWLIITFAALYLYINLYAAPAIKDIFIARNKAISEAIEEGKRTLESAEKLQSELQEKITDVKNELEAKMASFNEKLKADQKKKQTDLENELAAEFRAHEKRVENHIKHIEPELNQNCLTLAESIINKITARIVTKKDLIKYLN
jgi:F-type H+-transporting ATPase subunit b